MKGVFEKYLLALRKTRTEDKTEHTDRSALETLLQAIAEDVDTGIHVQHEPKREADKGAPDFKVTKSGLILGYVENKGIDENLNKILKSEQIKKYLSLSKNIILTDYLDFIWLNKYGDPQRERLCHATDLENKELKLDEARVEAVAKLLKGFFSSAPEGIGRAQQLALALAVRSRLLRDYLGEELVRQEREHKEGRLYGLYLVFRDQVFHELTLKEFADALAQMLAYGLFLARLNSDSEPVTLHNARQYIPGSFRLIRELIDFLTELEKGEYRDVRWVVEEVLSIVNNLDLRSIHEDLSFRGRAISPRVRAADEEEHRLFERDPFVFFYEPYLKEPPNSRNNWQSGHSKNPSERTVEETVRERRTKRGVVKLKKPKVVRRKVKTAIGALIEDYKFVDGKPLGEQNPKWLQDDYVKFIRFAQKKMQDADEGVVGIITNHSYLDNPTFRGMRRSLINTFDQIYVLDLHGSTKPKELSPPGLRNDNVFDIQKGVAIALFVKKPGIPRGVWYSEFWGTRLEKYQQAAEASFDVIAWVQVQCFAPYYMFRPLDWSGWDVYQAGWAVADSLNPPGEKAQIFDLNVLGFQTHRDHFAIAIDRSAIENRVTDMIESALTDHQIGETAAIK